MNGPIFQRSNVDEPKDTFTIDNTTQEFEIQNILDNP